MKKPSKTVSVQLPTEDIEALESLIGQTMSCNDKTFNIKRLSDAIRFAMADEIDTRKWIIKQARLKEEKAAAAKAKREAKKAAASEL
jgi:Arc/MetJ-type ribon-helix-helix transcriptional regulator